MNEETNVVLSRNALLRVLSNNTNSSDVERIVEAIENFIDDKIAKELKLLEERGSE